MTPLKFLHIVVINTPKGWRLFNFKSSPLHILFDCMIFTEEEADVMTEQEIENVTTEMSVNKDESDGSRKDGDQPKDKDENMEEMKVESPEEREDENKTESEERKERKIDPKDWPLRDIKEPHENDVLFGRGGKHLDGLLIYDFCKCRNSKRKLIFFCFLFGYHRGYKSCKRQQTIPKNGGR